MCFTHARITNSTGGAVSIRSRRFGIERALWIARLFHFQAFVVLVLLYAVSGLAWPALAGVVGVGLLLVYQHTLIRANDLARMNAAFFTTNAFVSVILLVSFGAAVFIGRPSALVN